MNTNGCFHFSSSLCLRVLVWVSTVWCLCWSKKTDESRYDVCPVLLLPRHHQSSTAWVMMMRAARTGAYYFTIVKDNGPASYCAEESVQASNYCFSGPSQHDPKKTHNSFPRLVKLMPAQEVEGDKEGNQSTLIPQCMFVSSNQKYTEREKRGKDEKQKTNQDKAALLQSTEEGLRHFLNLN